MLDAPASGLLPGSPRVCARIAFGNILAGLSGLGSAHVPSAFILGPVLYLGYYFRAHGVLKVEIRVFTGLEAIHDNRRDND